ncbi:MAG: hypothetical protein P1V97_21325 [Planctomycetota bacterium]|nr:hypothetical protein [Planctomycetota bacterium]
MTAGSEIQFRIILHSFDPSRTLRVQSELSRLFQVDDRTASSIVSAVPIVVFDNVEPLIALRIRERLKVLDEAGAVFVTTDGESEEIPRINWPEMPEFAQIATDEFHAEVANKDKPATEPTTEAAPVPAAKDGPSGYQEFSRFSCPTCGEHFAICKLGEDVDGPVDTMAAIPATPPSRSTTSSRRVSRRETRSYRRVADSDPVPAESAESLSGSRTFTFEDPLLKARQATQDITSGRHAGEDDSGPEGESGSKAPDTTNARATDRLTSDPTKVLQRDGDAGEPSSLEMPTYDVKTSKDGPQSTLDTHTTAKTTAPKKEEDPFKGSKLFDSNEIEAPKNIVSEPVLPPPSRDPITDSGEFSFSSDSELDHKTLFDEDELAAMDGPSESSGEVPRGDDTSLPDDPFGEDDDDDEFNLFESAEIEPATTPRANPRNPLENESFSDKELDEMVAAKDSGAEDLSLFESNRAPRKSDPFKQTRADDHDDNDPFADDHDPFAEDEDDDDEDFLLGKSSRRKRETRPDDSGSMFDDSEEQPRSRQAIRDEMADEVSSVLADSNDSFEAADFKASKSRTRDDFDGLGLGDSDDDLMRIEDSGSFVDDRESQSGSFIDDQESQSGSFDGMDSGLLDSGEDDDFDDFDEGGATHVGMSGSALKGSKTLDEAAKEAFDEDSDEDDFSDFDSVTDMSSRSGEHRRGTPALGFRRDMPYDEALKLFSNEDLNPLDTGEGLLAEPLESLSASHTQLEALDRVDSAEMKAALKGNTEMAAAPATDELSDSQSNDDWRRLEFGETYAMLDNKQRSRKERRSGRLKRRGLVPLNASDEDFDLLGDSPAKNTKSGRQKRSDPDASAEAVKKDKSTRASKRVDPFARANSARTKKADPFESEEMLESSRLSAAENSAAKKRAAAPKRRAPVKSEPGEYGLVLSRINNDGKRQEAAALISNIQGSHLDEALRLTERTIIPVLKGVSKELAERHLESFKNKQISGRVTRRRSGATGSMAKRRN